MLLDVFFKTYVTSSAATLLLLLLLLFPALPVGISNNPMVDTRARVTHAIFFANLADHPSVPPGCT